MRQQAIRCAVYTRKSSEEGLAQDFNSLDAQRVAAEAYIASQAGEGWTLQPEQYDDGGFSGGSMERPGLKRLLADIEAGLIDVVVVYKIDRLTRSLTDFARIVEIFEKHDVSFVSVTQSFNTTSSMGRLMLNVLLSFAQFEREVTGERIRDKIAASKARGMWMGGLPPLGYDIPEPGSRTLRVNREEASRVRHIFIAAQVAIVPAGKEFACTPTRVWDGDGPIWCEEGPRIRLAVSFVHFEPRVNIPQHLGMSLRKSRLSPADRDQ